MSKEVLFTYPNAVIGIVGPHSNTVRQAHVEIYVDGTLQGTVTEDGPEHGNVYGPGEFSIMRPE